MNEEIIIKEGVHFIGSPCVKCGSCVRLVTSGKCAPCKNETTRKSHENRKEKHNNAHFEGSTCMNCGGIIRYVSNGSCVNCIKKRVPKHRQTRKQKHNGVFYEGKPCKRCGNGTRYTRNGGCVVCEKELGKQWKKNNPGKRKEIKHRRRAKELNVEGSFTAQQWLDLCNYYGNKCLCCLRDDVKLEADHVIPLNNGGTNWITNIQPLCRTCNASKHTKEIDYRPDPTLINPAPATN